jgi:6-phosphogluconolactonase
MTDPTPASNHPFDLRVVRDAAEAGALAADLLTEAAHTAVAARGRFTLAIPGGSVPTPVFTALAEREFPWDATRLLWVDERAVPPDHEHSNYGAFARDLLPSLPIPAAQVLRMRGELGPDDGARDYTTVLGNALAGHPLDAALLGIGEDGHVASLFPGKDALEATDPVLPIHDSPQAPARTHHPLTPRPPLRRNRRCRRPRPRQKGRHHPSPRRHPPPRSSPRPPRHRPPGRDLDHRRHSKAGRCLTLDHRLSCRNVRAWTQAGHTNHLSNKDLCRTSMPPDALYGAGGRTHVDSGINRGGRSIHKCAECIKENEVYHTEDKGGPRGPEFCTPEKAQNCFDKMNEEVKRERQKRLGGG